MKPRAKSYPAISDIIKAEEGYSFRSVLCEGVQENLNRRGYEI